MAYSSIERTTAVEIAQRNGGSLTVEVLGEIRAALGRSISAPAVRTWLAQDTPAQKEKLSQEKNAAAATLDAYFEQVAWRMLEHALRDEVLSRMDGRAAVTSAAIAVDKMQLLRGLPTEIVAVLPQVLKAIEQRGLSAGDVFEAMLAELVSHDADGG